MKTYFFYKRRIIEAVRATSLEQAQGILRTLGLHGYVLLSIMPAVSIWSMVMPHEDPEVDAIPGYDDDEDDDDDKTKKPQPGMAEA